MNLRSLRRKLGKALGFYEVTRYHPRRGYSYIGSSQDAWMDMEKSTLCRIRDESRHLEQNDWLANKLASVFCQYVVGADGLQATPASSDSAFNALAAEEWRRASQFIDIETQTGFGDFQWRSCWRRFFDGDAFWLKVRGSTGKARLQLIEGFRVRTPKGIKETARLNNGVEVDEQGRPVAYYVATGADSEDFQRIDAALIIPIMDRSRSRQTRSLPHLTPVINQIKDLRTLFGLEMDKAHEHAVRAMAVLTETGEAPSDEDLLREGSSVANGDALSGQSTDVHIKNIKEATGSSVVYMKQGEDIKSLGSNSPSAATQWLWDYSIGMVCAGAQISKLLVMPWSLQGTVTRADLDAQAQIFRAQSAIEANAVRAAYEFVIGDAISRGAFRGVRIPSDATRCNVRPPRGVNVDVGRNSNAALAELKAGGRTFQGWYSELGLDWMDELRQKAKEVAFIKGLANELGVEPQLISDIIVAQIQRAQEATTV